MSENVKEPLLNELSDILQQEKWTRVPLAKYSLAQLEKLDELVGALLREGLDSEAKEMCRQILGESKEAKKSISAQYVLGSLQLVGARPEDTLLLSLSELFANNHKPTLAQHIGEKVLENFESKGVLHLLSKLYEITGQEAKKQELWEKLARIDLEDTDSVRSLALLYESQDKKEEAYEFYKKAIYRYIEARNFSGVREMWIKLLAYIERDFDLFLTLEKKITRVFDGTENSENKEKRVCLVLEDLYRVCFAQQQWDHALQVVKLLLRYQPNSHTYRKDLINCLKERYQANDCVDTFLVKSHLTTNSRNVFEALEDFEKRIFFEKGNFVYHKTWNVGVIRVAQEENLIIDFVQKRGHSLSLSMAMEVLESLSKNDIRVYKAVWPKDKLKAKLEEDVRWGIVTILNSYGSVSLKTMKAELYPAIFKESEWNNWSAKAKDTLERDTYFAKSPDKTDQFVMRNQSISFDEKKYMEFKASPDFFIRYKVFSDFMKDSSEGVSSQYFIEMFSFFSSHLKTINKVNGEVLASYLIVERYIKLYPFLKDKVRLFPFNEIIKDNVDIRDLFESLEVVELKKDCLAKIYAQLPAWETYFARIFPSSTPLINKRIFELLGKYKPNFFKAMLQNIIERSGEKKEAYFYLVRHYEDLEDFIKIKSDQRLLKLLDILIQTNTEILVKREAVANRKLQKHILNYFFEDGFLQQALKENASLDLCQRIFEILREFPPLSVKQLMETQTIIKSLYPDFVFDKLQEIAPKKEEGSFYTLLSSFSQKQRELQHLKEVEMPENSKQIGEAMALGDLKENAEYHAAKERQTLLTARVNKLNIELDRARVVEDGEIKGDRVTFGTKVFLNNKLKKGKKEVYTILGPWESDPDKGILSYKSPFAEQLLNAQVGDELIFEINTHKSKYLVSSIEAIKLD